MQRLSYHFAETENTQPHGLAALGHYRGALWGMLAGVPIGLATSLNLSFESPWLTLTGVAVFWIAGGFCGHNMQTLLDETR
jgi:hypothetical protein